MSTSEFFQIVFEKINSCLFIPNCTRNHVITNTEKQIVVNGDVISAYVLR